MAAEIAVMCWLRRHWEKKNQAETSREEEPKKISYLSKHDGAPSDEGVTAIEVALNPVAETTFLQPPDADEPCPSDPIAPVMHQRWNEAEQRYTLEAQA